MSWLAKLSFGLGLIASSHKPSPMAGGGWPLQRCLIVHIHELTDRASTITAARFWQIRFDAGRRMLDARDKMQEGFFMLLPEALNLARSCLVSDPRDKIFGVMSLVDGTAEPLPIVNYQGDLVEVYISCAKLLLAGNTGISLLSMIDHTTQAPWLPGGKANKPMKKATSRHHWPSFPLRVNGLPSWCPDFSQTPRPAPLSEICGADVLSAATGVPSRFKLTDDDHWLQVQGYDFDTIVDTAEDSCTFLKRHVAGFGDTFCACCLVWAESTHLQGNPQSKCYGGLSSPTRLMPLKWNSRTLRDGTSKQLEMPSHRCFPPATEKKMPIGRGAMQKQ